MASRPTDGWTRGAGSTGHPTRALLDKYSMAQGQEESRDGAREPTADEYLSRAEKCISDMQAVCNRGGTEEASIEESPRFGDPLKYDDPCPCKDQNSALVESGPVVVVAEGTRDPSDRQRASDFFAYDEAGDRVGDKSKSRSSAAPGDDGMVYSRVHGYRIKIDDLEDTTLAYKKVLGDINVCF